ncbi:AhpC/TSA family protein [Tumebacillus sp. BK434]|uniref:TlpA family protein disulfide reductase n=1 Tax=Tumebacillus sp. BK434 TaxID=2512169 RepID=UPI0010F4017F|nr:thioredoxin fold domain-containing protein [Tumebacillus sp. BK434]TCP53919.1 AhpC/TSA family protein [Tumebacillus sp. BK434]
MEQALIVSNVGLWIVVSVHFFLYHRFAKQLGGFLQKVRLEPPNEQKRGLHIGDRAPEFRVLDHVGREVVLEAGQKVMLLFTLSKCEICKEIFPHLKEVRTQYADKRWIVITEGEVDDEKAAYVPTDVPLLSSSEIRKNYGIKYVPALVLLDQNLRVIANDRVFSYHDLLKRLELYDKK